MKCGLEDSAAFYVRGFVAREQAVADQFAKEGRAGIAHEEVLPGDKDVLNPIGLVDEVDPLVEDSKVRNGAEGPGGCCINPFSLFAILSLTHENRFPVDFLGPCRERRTVWQSFIAQNDQYCHHNRRGAGGGSVYSSTGRASDSGPPGVLSSSGKHPADSGFRHTV